MKKTQKKIMEKAIQKFAQATISLEVNSTCPFAVYQPNLPKSVEKLRKK